MRTFLLFLLLLVAVCALALDVGDSVVVQVRETEVRSAPGFLSRVLGSASYESAGSVLEVRADWVRVEFPDVNLTGWVHSSSLLAPQVARGGLFGGGSRNSQRTTSSDEIALAGRGFNSAVEAEYQSETGLDFSEVDEMEEWVLPPEVLGEFFATAGLGFGEAE